MLTRTLLMFRLARWRNLKADFSSHLRFCSSISFQVPIAWTLTIPDSRAKEVDHLKNHRTTTRRKREPSTGKLDLKSRPCSSNLGMQYQFLIRRCNSSAAST
ncbi:hypothetical protein V6N12_027310 [Hibiscus sabdariffa]|uniref:Uncharacterized protein n=1 Tax=Hibiscus sabdariffa TaxID=183260 RepID=A0ABR2DUW3_9ROSI